MVLPSPPAAPRRQAGPRFGSCTQSLASVRLPPYKTEKAHNPQADPSAALAGVVLNAHFASFGACRSECFEDGGGGGESPCEDAQLHLGISGAQEHAATAYFPTCRACGVASSRLL